MTAFRRRDFSARILGDGQRAAGGSQILSPVVVPKGDVPTLGVTILNVQAEDPKDPGVISVDFDLQRLGPIPGPAAGGAVSASLDWGTGKARHQATCDIVHGTRISLRASTLRIDALYIASPSMPDVRVSASAAYGQAAGGEPPTISETIVIPDGTGAVLTIPKYAKSVTIYTNTIGATVVAEFALDTAATVVLVRSGALESPIDLMNCSTAAGGFGTPPFLRIFNPNVTPATFVIYTAVFKLSFS